MGTKYDTKCDTDFSSKGSNTLVSGFLGPIGGWGDPPFANGGCGVAGRPRAQVPGPRGLGLWGAGGGAAKVQVPDPPFVNGVCEQTPVYKRGVFANGG